MEQNNAGNGYAIASMVCGIVGILIGCCCAMIGILLGGIGVALALYSKKLNGGVMVTFAKVGLILGIISAVLHIINAILGAVLSFNQQMVMKDAMGLIK